MTLSESLAEFREMRDLLDELCQQMYNDLNEGVPSPVLRYLFIQQAIKHVEEEPHDDSTVQALMRSYLQNAFLTASAAVTVQTITVPN